MSSPDRYVPILSCNTQTSFTPHCTTRFVRGRGRRRRCQSSGETHGRVRVDGGDSTRGTTTARPSLARPVLPSFYPQLAAHALRTTPHNTLRSRSRTPPTGSIVGGGARTRTVRRWRRHAGRSRRIARRHTTPLMRLRPSYSYYPPAVLSRERWERAPPPGFANTSQW